MLNDKESAFNERKMSLKQYRKMKLKILKNDFCIKLTEEELAHAETMTTEIQIDQFCLGAINKRFDN